MRISYWSSDVCSSDLDHARRGLLSARRPLSAPSVREKWRRAAGGEFPLVEEPQMSLPTVIHSRVDPAAVTKVTRLFNNTLGDILSELIQNARRAGASAFDIKVIDAEEAAFLAIDYEGHGTEDPSVILALG